MILTGNEIQKKVLAGDIVLDPFEESLINPNSYNYRLGEDLIEISYDVNNMQGIPQQKKLKIPKSGLILKPKKLYLGVTSEVIGSTKYVPSLIGRSSLGRLGLFLQITADLGHIGTCHKWTLELTVVQPLKVYPRMRIGQVSFWTASEVEGLKGHLYNTEENSYSKFNEPTYSLIEKLLN